MANNRTPRFPPSPPPEPAPSSHILRTGEMPEIFFQYLNRYIYIWMQNGQGFWMFPTNVDDEKLSGYIWNGGWIPDSINWRGIESFY